MAVVLLAIAALESSLGVASVLVSPGARCVGLVGPRARQPQSRTALRVEEKRGPNGKLIRCPGCGRGQRVDCDGTGKLSGGIQQVVKDFDAISFSAPCPRFKGEYKRRGKDAAAFFDPTGQVRATWRSLTRIRLREVADVKGEATGDSVKPYE